MASKRATLPSERRTKAMEKRVISAAATKFGRGKAVPWFEHGHWWVIVQEDDEDVPYGVVDTSSGFDFERIG